MELYKFINERTVEKYYGGFVVIDNTIYTNPTEETLALAGFKCMECDEMPEVDEAREYLNVTYTDGDVITAHYTVLPIDTEGAEEA